MTLKDITVTHELAEKMAKAGFPQNNGIWYWIKCFQYIERESEKEVYDKKELWIVESMDKINLTYANYFRAPTFTEIWTELPSRILLIQNDKHCNFTIKIKRYSIAYVDNIRREILVEINKEKPINQDAAAELWLWVKENGYL